MRNYRYFARAGDGGRHEGYLAAENIAAVIDHLRIRGLIAVRVAVESSRFQLRFHPVGRSAATLATVYRSLGIMLEAGIALRRALTIVSEQIHDAATRESFVSLIGAVDAGRSLASGMRMHREVFPPAVCALVAAAEQSGRLGEALERYAAVLERRRSLVQKVRNALLYPAFVLAAAIGLVGLMLTTVVPTLISLYAQMHVDEPEILSAAQRAADFFSNPLHPALIACGGVAALAAARLWAGAHRETADALRLRLPGIGPILRQAIIARWARLFASLLASGIAINDALAHTVAVVESAIYEREIAQVRTVLEDGGTISAALAGSAWFEPLAQHLVTIGEETGRLEQHVLRLAEMYERRLNETLDAAVTFIEPLMIVLVGGIVGATVLAVIVPLYGLIGALH